MEVIYPPNIPAFVDDNNPQILTNFASALFNTQAKALSHDGHLFSFRNVMLDSLMHHNEYLKGISGEARLIKVALLQTADIFSISSDNLK